MFLKNGQSFVMTFVVLFFFAIFVQMIGSNPGGNPLFSKSVNIQMKA